MKRMLRASVIDSLWLLTQWQVNTMVPALFTTILTLTAGFLKPTSKWNKHMQCSLGRYTHIQGMS